MSPTIVPATDGRIGVLLINLGAPDTEYRSVRRYLKEFLSDGPVIEEKRIITRRPCTNRHYLGC